MARAKSSTLSAASTATYVDADRDMWDTTPEKKYREAGAYRVQDRIERFKAEGLGGPGA